MSNDISEAMDGYVKDVTKQLDDWRGGLDRLKARADDAVAAEKRRFDKRIADLIEAAEHVEGDLKGLQQANERVWEDVTTGLGEAWERLHEALDKASSRFE